MATEPPLGFELRRLGVDGRVTAEGVQRNPHACLRWEGRFLLLQNDNKLKKNKQTNKSAIDLCFTLYSLFLIRLLKEENEISCKRTKKTSDHI